MSRFFTNVLIGLIFTAFCYVQLNIKHDEIQHHLSLKLVHQCMLAKHTCNKRSVTKTLERRYHSNMHNVIIFLLICSGDISLNPGPSVGEYTRNLSPRLRSLIFRTCNTQKKMIESMLHVTYLKKYDDANVPPPGLQFKKRAQISNADELNETWTKILKKASMDLNNTLIIDSHNRKTIVLGKQLR